MVCAKTPDDNNIDCTVPADDVSTVCLQDNTLYVSGDAYVYGITEESGVQVVCFCKKNNRNVKKISSKKSLIASKKGIKKIQKIQTNDNIKEVKFSNANTNIYFSRLQIDHSTLYILTDFSKVITLKLIEDIQLLMFDYHKNKIIQSTNLLFCNLRMFRFCRPPPILL
jgi:hypothetical protein